MKKHKKYIYTASIILITCIGIKLYFHQNIKRHTAAFAVLVRSDFTFMLFAWKSFIEKHGTHPKSFKELAAESPSLTNILEKYEECNIKLILPEHELTKNQAIQLIYNYPVIAMRTNRLPRKSKGIIVVDNMQVIFLPKPYTDDIPNHTGHQVMSISEFHQKYPGYIGDQVAEFYNEQQSRDDTD